MKARDVEVGQVLEYGGVQLRRVEPFMGCENAGLVNAGLVCARNVHTGEAWKLSPDADVELIDNTLHSQVKP